MAMTYIITCYTTFSWFVNLYTRIHNDTKIQSTLPLTQPPSPPPTICRPQVSHRTDRCVQSCEGNSPGQPLRSPHRRKSILSLMYVVKCINFELSTALFQIAAVSYQYLIYHGVHNLFAAQESMLDGRS